MAWISEIAPGDAGEDLKELYRAAREPDGSVDSIMTIHSLNPPSLRAHLDLYKVTMYGPSELSRVQREMIGVVVSAVNDCHY